jgi:hypothetical protein
MTGTSRRQAARILIAVPGLVALGEAGHQLFERMGWDAGHHAFHLAYGPGRSWSSSRSPFGTFDATGSRGSSGPCGLRRP